MEKNNELSEKSVVRRQPLKVKDTSLGQNHGTTKIVLTKGMFDKNKAINNHLEHYF